MWNPEDFEERYKPKAVSDIVFADGRSQTLLEQIITKQRPFPIAEGKCGILLYGIPGTGKSALAKILPDEMEAHRCGNPVGTDGMYEKVQPGNNGMNMLARISNHAVLVPLQASQHYYVLDEVDNLNAQAMAMLKSVMNTPGCVFILTTNHFDRIEAGVRSRCHCIPFNAAPAEKWLPLAHRIIGDAGLRGISDDQMLAVIQTGKGCARDIQEALIDVVQKAQELQCTKCDVIPNCKE